jgi:hypothetical protein
METPHYIESLSPHLQNAARPTAWVRSLVDDRVSLALCVVFLLAAAFYLWTAGTTYALTIDGGSAIFGPRHLPGAVNPYNELANAFLHFRLSVGRAPTALLNLTEPYNPAQNHAIKAYYLIYDYALYGGRLYLPWGPAPVIVLLVPLHLLGIEPSSSLTVALYAIAGLGFGLAALRVLVRVIGNVPMWMCVLAACAMAFSSVVPFILRRPNVYEEAIAGGFCFVMAGVWLALSALADRRASWARLVLMSLCFGLAAGSRPTLGLTALVLVPVYMSLRRTCPRRGLLLALAVPVGACFMLLLAYNQARFANPLEFGIGYQLAGYNPHTVRFSDPSYVLPSIWYYLVSLPRPSILFPFILLSLPPASYPLSPPANYLASEAVGGLLPMTPIVIFLVALPWIWRRRPELLGPLAAALLILASAGVAILLFLSYEFFSTAERYAVDFSTLFLLGALAAWLALSRDCHGRRRRLVRVGGGLLAAWGCIAGFAVSFAGNSTEFLARAHPGLWATLQNIGSPLSTAAAMVAGHPVLAEVRGPSVVGTLPTSYTNLGSNVTAFWLGAGEQEDLTIVSPDDREAALMASMVPGVHRTGTRIEFGVGAARVGLRGPGHASRIYAIPSSGRAVRVPIRLSRGLNRLVLSPLVPANQTSSTIDPRRQVLGVEDLSLASLGDD